MAILLAVLIVVLVFHPTEAAFYYPDLQTSLLEHILVDNWGAYASNFSSAVTPCTRYVTETGDAALNSGRTTAAQWLRVLFHDIITANVSAGTGGLDASIGFETARGENSGSAFNDSFTFWRPFVNEAVSMADLIAIGTVTSNNLCGGRPMKYQPGRTDATSAGVTTGVPAPETDLDETLLFFERAGFDRTDAIKFTACGHTLGSVHHGGFPDVVDTSAVMPNNTNGGSNFDTTRGVFDPKVVHEYVSWTGNKGGPLVTTANVSTQSDLRLYESDGNATMIALQAQGDGFLDTCVELMSRAINTVPSSVQLKPVISAIAVKPVNVTYDFGPDGKLALSGKIRILTAPIKQAPKFLTIAVSSHETRLVPEASTGSSKVFGATQYFPFSLTGPSIANAQSFSITGFGVNSQTFAIQSQSFVVPSLTSLASTVLNATIATKGFCSDLSVQVAAPFKQPGTLAPKITASSLILALSSSSSSNGTAGYRFCAGQAQLDSVPTGSVTVKVLKGVCLWTSCLSMAVLRAGRRALELASMSHASCWAFFLRRCTISLPRNQSLSYTRNKTMFRSPAFLPVSLRLETALGLTGPPFCNASVSLVAPSFPWRSSSKSRLKEPGFPLPSQAQIALPKDKVSTTSPPLDHPTTRAPYSPSTFSSHTALNTASTTSSTTPTRVPPATSCSAKTAIIGVLVKLGRNQIHLRTTALPARFSAKRFEQASDAMLGGHVIACPGHAAVTREAGDEAELRL